MASWTEKENAIRALERDGKVNPSDLIKAAKAKNHPCHEDFTWDVTKAAAERWREQARELIRRVHFEVQVEEVTQRVVMYVPNHSDEHQFLSLPKIRNKTTAGDTLAVEVAMLYGMAKRVYGIALAKQDFVGRDKVVKLNSVVSIIGEMKAELEG